MICWLDLHPNVQFETRTVPELLYTLEEQELHAGNLRGARILANAISYLDDPYWYAEHHNVPSWRETTKKS